MTIDTKFKTITITGQIPVKEVLELVDKFDLWEYTVAQAEVSSVTSDTALNSFNWSGTCSDNFNQIHYIQTN